MKRHNGIHIDLEELGYNKLLGGGQASRRLILEIASHSRVASEKIEMARGKIFEVKQQKGSSVA